MKFKIRGIYGWSKGGQAKTEEGTLYLSGARDDEPADRLAELKKAVAEGRVEFAPDERGGFVIQWSAEGYGFGELTVSMGDDGSIEIDDECTSRDKLALILMAVLEQGTTLSEKREKEPRA